MKPASATRRTFAKLFDGLLSGGVMLLVNRWYSDTVAVVAMWAWFMACDGFGSWGKWLMGIQCVHGETGSPCTVFQSLQRNIVFLPGMARALMVMGARDGFLEKNQAAIGALSIVGLVMTALELRWMMRRFDRRRLGDAMGNTRVVMGRSAFW